jgi:ribosome-associated protein
LLFKNTDNLVPINKTAGPVKAKTKAKAIKKKVSDDVPSAVKAKRNVKSKAAGTAYGIAKTAGKPKAAGTAHGMAKTAGKPKVEGSAAAPDKVKAAAARTAALKSVVIDALDGMKALEVKVLDVRGLTDVADTMVIASGTSDRHVRSVAKNVVEKTKAAGFRPHGVEGQQDSDWVLIDLSEMIVHVMLPRVREFYGLEKLWDMTATKRAARA